jgi:hypothetical protein
LCSALKFNRGLTEQPLPTLSLSHFHSSLKYCDGTSKLGESGTRFHARLDRDTSRQCCPHSVVWPRPTTLVAGPTRASVVSTREVLRLRQSRGRVSASIWSLLSRVSSRWQRETAVRRCCPRQTENLLTSPNSGDIGWVLASQVLRISSISMIGMKEAVGRALGVPSCQISGPQNLASSQHWQDFIRIPTPPRARSRTYHQPSGYITRCAAHTVNRFPPMSTTHRVFGSTVLGGDPTRPRRKSKEVVGSIPTLEEQNPNEFS